MPTLPGDERRMSPSPSHSLGDHSNLDSEDARLFSGRHSLQAELPAGELDGEFHFNLQGEAGARPSHPSGTHSPSSQRPGGLANHSPSPSKWAKIPVQGRSLAQLSKN